MLFKFQLNAEKANVHIIYQRPSYTVEKTIAIDGCIVSDRLPRPRANINKHVIREEMSLLFW